MTESQAVEAINQEIGNSRGQATFPAMIYPAPDPAGSSKPWTETPCRIIHLFPSVASLVSYRRELSKHVGDDNIQYMIFAAPDKHKVRAVLNELSEVDSPFMISHASDPRTLEYWGKCDLVVPDWMGEMLKQNVIVKRIKASLDRFTTEKIPQKFLEAL